MLKALNNLARAVNSISANQANDTFDLKNLTMELSIVSTKRALFTYDVFLIAIPKEFHISVSITTDKRPAEITPETLTVIKIPKKKQHSN